MKIYKYNFFYFLALLIFLVSCAQTENDKLGDAQFCLDKLRDNSEAGVTGCLQKIDGLTSPESYLLRCSASFIQEGFSDPNTLLKIVENMSKSTSNSNPTAAVLSVLIFKSKTGATAVAAATNNETFAQDTQSYCIASGNKGMILISSFASMATSIAAATATLSNGASNLFDGTATPAEISAAVLNASPTILGNTAIIAYQTNCTSTIDTSKQDLCSTLSSAMTNGNNDPATIGASLQTLIGK